MRLIPIVLALIGIAWFYLFQLPKLKSVSYIQGWKACGRSPSCAEAKKQAGYYDYWERHP